MEQGGSANLSDGNTFVELSSPAAVGMVLVLTLGDLLSIVGNILVLVAVIGNTKLQTNTNFFIMNLSIIDLLAGLLLIPIVIFSVWKKAIQTGPLCNFLAFLDTVYATASSLTIACIAMDRYHSIVNCLHYEYLVTHRRTVLAIAWAWFQSLVVAICPIAHWGEYTFGGYQFKCSLQVPDKHGFLYFKIITCIVAPYTVTVFCYTRIHLVARRHAKNMVRIQIQDNGKRIRHTHSSRKTKLVYIVVGLYTICWLPIFSLKLAQTIVPGTSLPWPFIETIFSTLALLNGSCNPVVYALITTHYRAGLVRVYRRLRRKFGKHVPPGQDLTKSSYSFSRSVSSFYRFLAEREAMARDLDMVELPTSRESTKRRDSTSISTSKHSSAGEKGRRQVANPQNLTIPDDRRSKTKLNVASSSVKNNGVASILPDRIPEKNKEQLGLCGSKREENNSDEGVGYCTVARKNTGQISLALDVRPCEDMCTDDSDSKVKVTNSSSKPDKGVTKGMNVRIGCILRKDSKTLGNQDKKVKFHDQVSKEQTESLMKDARHRKKDSEV